MEVEYIPNILSTGIDNHLVYGQVGATWTKALEANLIAVADDTTAKDRIQQPLMNVTAKLSGVGIRSLTTEKTAVIIGRMTPEQKIFIVYRMPRDVRRLVEAGVTLKEVDAGNTYFSEGKHAMTKKVYVDDEDMDDLKYPVSEGINAYTQDAPRDPKPATE